ncbi:MAG: GNAT family N-acetyltransferase, partial [Candidatus Brockarchaeota archaeon]|nr:GNAT family N-acetyltransferase [Candidatus Brockarchaeota archaeon]
MSQVVFRRYAPGDEEGIVKVMNEAFSTFKNFGLTPEVWKSYTEVDEGFKLENALVAELEHQIVGHVQLVERDLKIGEKTFIKNGGIANVCTLPEARGRGISTGLMKLAIEISKTNGYPMSTLFTGYGGVAHRVYRSVGYADTYFPPYFVGSVEEMKSVQERTKGVEGVKVREFKDGDEAELLDIYELSSSYYTGIVRRTEKYWRKKLTERSSTHSFFFEKFDPYEVIVAEEDGEITGYSYLTFWKRKEKPFRSAENGSIREVVFKPGHYKTFLKLVNESINRMLLEGVKTLDLSIPFDQDYLTVFDDLKVTARMGMAK